MILHWGRCPQGRKDLFLLKFDKIKVCLPGSATDFTNCKLKYIKYWFASRAERQVPVGITRGVANLV